MVGTKTNEHDETTLKQEWQ